LINTEKYKKHIKIAKKVRADSIMEVFYGQSGHIGSALSMVEILVYLYEDILKHDPKNPNWEDRDIFILSKGHAASGFYAMLAEKGFFPREWMKKYYQDGGMLSGHVSHYVPGVEVSTGALGHGLPMAIGYAIHFKRNNKRNRVFTLLGDGELNEGSNWEAILFAPHHKLDNLTVIIDYNKIQALGCCEDVLTLEPLAQKLIDFHWEVIEIDGHNFSDLEKGFKNIPIKPGKPSCIIAHTVKGKGISFLENTVSSHYFKFNKELLEKAYKELGVKLESNI